MDSNDGALMRVSLEIADLAGKELDILNPF